MSLVEKKPRTIQEYNRQHGMHNEIRDPSAILREVRLAHEIKRKKLSN